MSEKRKQLWVVDNEPYFLARLRIAAAMIDWEVIRLDGNHLIKLPQDKPELILLDRELSRNVRENKALFDKWLNVLNEYKKRCYLITHNKEEDSRRLATKLGLAGLLIKPLDVERIEEWARLAQKSEVGAIESSDTQDGQSYWREYIKAINVPTIVLDQDLHLVAQNTAGRSASIFSDDKPEAGAAPNAEARRMLNMMLHELEPPNQSRVKNDCAIRCEWDSESTQWREWRLRSYPEKFAPGKYMLTFVNYSKDANLIPLSRASHSSLNEYMDELAKHLAELWGITRVRLYRVEELVEDSSNVKVDSDRAEKRHLLLPILQFGGGLTASKENWQQNTQLLSENQYAQRLLSAGNAKLVVHENNEAKGFPDVGFAKNTTRANILIRDSGGRLVGMISCDRRFDHFESKREWQDDDNRHARLAMQFVSDLGELSESEANRMQGLFNLAHDHLALILARLADERLSAWQQQISSIFTERVDASLSVKPSSGDHNHKMTAVREAFKELLVAWQRGQVDLASGDPFAKSGDVLQKNIVVKNNSISPSHLDSIYIADFISHNGFSSELGAGDVWNLRKNQGVYWRAMSPHSEAILIENFCTYVLQNFQDFNKKAKQSSGASNVSGDTPLDTFLNGLRRSGLEGAGLVIARNTLGAIRSWAAVKIPQPMGEPWLLVAVSKREYGWTRERVRWLQVLAERVTMLLRWWQAESQREWYRAAMAHELAKPMQHLEFSIIACREDSMGGKFGEQLEDMQSLVEYHRHLVTNIQTIADGGTPYESSSSDLTQTSTTLREEWRRCDWARRYCSAVDFSAIVEPIPAVQLSLPPSVLAQSIIILLINAHRYHYRPAGVAAQAELKVNDVEISFRVRNAVNRAIPVSYYKDIFLPFVKLPGSVAGGVGIGLAVLDAFRGRYDMRCLVSDEASDEDAWRWQLFELLIDRSKL